MESRATVPCVECGSRRVSLASEKTGTLYTRGQTAFAQCCDCGFIFKIPISEADLLIASFADETVENERKCVRCGYILKSLRVGQPCPECAFPISPPPISDFLERRRRRRADRSFWSLPIALFCALIHAKLTGLFGAPSGLVMMGTYFASKGVIGLLTGSIKFGMRIGSPIRTGHSCVVFSFIAIGIGVVFFVALVLLHLGILK